MGTIYWRKNEEGYYIYLNLEIGHISQEKEKDKIYKNETLDVSFEKNKDILVKHKGRVLGTVSGDISKELFDLEDNFILAYIAEITNGTAIVRWIINDKAKVKIDTTKDNVISKKQLKIQRNRTKQEKRAASFMVFHLPSFLLYLFSLIIFGSILIVSVVRLDFTIATLIVAVIVGLSIKQVLNQVHLYKESRK